MNQFWKGCVTEGSGRFLVERPADNERGFSLCDDDQTWPGGFGSGMVAWRHVEADHVPAQERSRLGWLLDA